ncbi:MAG: EamA family transporter [Acidobacteriota bacterium]
MKWILLSIVVGATVVSDLLQSSQMKQHGEVTSGSGLARFGAALARNKLLILSIGCMAVSFFAFMALGQVAELSFAVPASAASVVLETILARVILGEQVNRNRWLGVVCVACGVYLLAA